MPFRAARSGLKMGSWLPADAVAPWSFRPSSSRAPGAASMGPSVLLRARELASLLSQQLLRAATFGSWLSPSGGEVHVGRDAGRAGDYRPGRGPGYRQGRAGVLCAGARPYGWLAAGPGGHDVLHDDPFAADHGRALAGSGGDPGRDGSDL